MTANKDHSYSNPFPGLRSYGPEEGHLFFGRAESTTRVVTKLLENRFVAVIGASGSGKSSLALSGVLPSLINGEAKDKKTWSYIVFRPEMNPIDNLASQLSELSSNPGFTYMPPAGVAASLHNRSEGIVDVVNKIRRNLRQQILIIVDQFEEIFRYSPVSSRGEVGDDATEFIDLIVNAARQPDHGLYIVLTLRSEYVSECSRFHSLTNLLNTGSYLLPQLSNDTLVSVIEEPIRLSGASIERTLVRTMISDLKDRPGNLPVLQHLLMRLWEHWYKKGDFSRSISMIDYESVGRMKGAISKHAGQALSVFNDRHKYVCSRVFRSITIRLDDGKEIRKPEKISEIAALTGCQVDEIITVAEVFRSAEYSFITPSGDIRLNEESILDLSHESIIRLWDTLRAWMNAEADSQKIYLQLAEAAEMYQEGKGKLWTPPELQIALKWRAENNPTITWAEKLNPAFERTMLFLKNSEDEYTMREAYTKAEGTTKIRRSRNLAGILGIIVLFSIIALGTFISLRTKSEKQKSVALQLKDDAVAYNMYLSDSLKTLSDTLKEANDEVVSSRLDISEALERATSAEKKASIAEDEVSKATAGRDEAVSIAALENQKKMISVAKSLALRSLTQKEDKDLRILLAWQGYTFNERYNGFYNDADIYSALYEINKEYGGKYYSTFDTGNNFFTAVACELSGKAMYTADDKGRILQWRTDDPMVGYNVIWEGDKVIECMAINSNASWLACACSSEIMMIPLIGKNYSFTLDSEGEKTTAMVFAADNSKLYTATEEGVIGEWDLASRKCRKLYDLGEGIRSIDLSPDNATLATITLNSKPVLWDVRTGSVFTDIRLQSNEVSCLRFVPWNSKLILTDNAGNMEIWDMSDMKRDSRLAAHNTMVSNLAFNTEEEQMITAGSDGIIKIWDLAEVEIPPAVITDSEDDIVLVAFVSEGRSFVTVTGGTITGRPSKVENMISDICGKVNRNMTLQEWYAYVGRDIEYENTCVENRYHIRVNEILTSK